MVRRGEVVIDTTSWGEVLQEPVDNQIGWLGVFSSGSDSNECKLLAVYQ